MILTTLMPRPLWWLGVKLDHAANSGNATSIAATDSAVSVLVILANEEQQISHRRHSRIRVASD